MRPKQWKVGSGLNRTSSRRSASGTCARIWWTLATMLRWERTTPLGSPSVPEVKRMTAGAPGSTTGGEQPRARSGRGRRQPSGVAPSAVADVFEVDEFGFRFQFADEFVEFGLLDEGVGGDDALHLRGLERGFHVARAGREVEHGGHAAIGVEREEGDDRAGAGRQHDADGLAALACLSSGRSPARRRRGRCRRRKVSGRLRRAGRSSCPHIPCGPQAGQRKRRSRHCVGHRRSAETPSGKPPSGAPPALFYVLAVI